MQSTFRYVHRPHGNHEFSWDVKLWNDTDSTVFTLVSSERTIEGVNGKVQKVDEFQLAQRLGSIQPGRFKEIPRAKVILDCNLGSVSGSFTLASSDGALFDVKVPAVLLDGMGLEAHEEALQLEGQEALELPAQSVPPSDKEANNELRVT